MPQTATDSQDVAVFEERVEIRLGEKLEVYTVHWDVIEKGLTKVVVETGGFYEQGEVISIPLIAIYGVYQDDTNILRGLGITDRDIVKSAVNRWIERSVEPNDTTYYELVDGLTGREVA